MEGCSDGTWNGARYFSCHPGYGFFCPLSSLLPDKRFSQVATAAVNRKGRYMYHVLNNTSH